MVFRDRVLLEVMASASLRRSEVVALHRTDFDPLMRSLRVRQRKTRSMKVVPLGSEVCSMLIEYLEVVRPAVDVPYLFLSSFGKPLSTGHNHDGHPGQEEVGHPDKSLISQLQKDISHPDAEKGSQNRARSAAPGPLQHQINGGLHAARTSDVARCTNYIQERKTCDSSVSGGAEDADETGTV